MRNRTCLMAAALLVLSVSCAKAGVDSPAGSFITKGVPAGLAEAEARWREAGITDYRMSVDITGCFCGAMHDRYSVTVVDGRVTQQTSPLGLKHPEALTVELLFKWLGAWGPDSLKATYNEFGVPIDAHVDAPNVADEQADYAVTFTPT